jgi:hypothetical protein
MTTSPARDERPLCSQCEGVVEVCAVCEREDCPEPMCYRCLRVEVRQSLPHPHAHGG